MILKVMFHPSAFAFSHTKDYKGDNNCCGMVVASGVTEAGDSIDHNCITLLLMELGDCPNDTMDAERGW